MRSIPNSWRLVTLAIVLATVALATILAFGLYVGRSEEATSVVMVGAGDIARCSGSGDEATATLLDGIPGTVFTTGDNAYPSGTASDFQNCYGPSWGRHKARTYPTPGNHEYLTTGASGYFGYYDAAAGSPSKGYYSFNRGVTGTWSSSTRCARRWEAAGRPRP